jgi:WD40 repeat protein
MAVRRRWLGRVFGIGVLIVAGYFAFDYAKTRPRCVITSGMHILFLSDAGETVLTGYTGITVGNPRTSGDLQPPVRVWNTRTGALVRELLADAPAANPHRYRLNGTLIAAYAGNGTIRLADWQTGREWDISAPRADVQTVGFSPDARFFSLLLASREDLLLARKDRERVLIDVADGKVVWSGDHEYFGPVFSQDGKAAYLYNRTRLERWDADTRRIERSCPIEAPLHFDASNEVFAYWSAEEQCVVVADCATLAVKSRLQPGFLRSPRGKHLSAKHVGNCLRLGFSPGGRWVASLPGDPHSIQRIGLKGEFELWDADTGRRVAAMPAHDPGVAWFPDDKCVYHGDLNEGQVIDPSTGRVKWDCAGGRGLWLLNHTTAVHLTGKGHFDILDAETGRSRHTIVHPFTGPHECPLSFSKDQDVVVACGPRRESRLLGYWPKWLPAWPAAKATAVQVIDVPTGRVLHELTFKKHVGADVSADGSTLVCFDWIPEQPAPGTTYSFQFYDMHNRRPWVWAIAAPAALLGLWLLWRTWRLRRRGATTSVQTVAPA